VERGGKEKDKECECDPEPPNLDEIDIEDVALARKVAGCHRRVVGL